MAETLSAQDKADLTAIRQHLPAGDPRAAKIDAMIGAPASNGPAPGSFGNFVNSVKDYGTGMLKSIPNSLANIDDSVSKIPYIGKALTTPLIGGASSDQARAHLHQAATPTNDAQKGGMTAGNALQFLIPGGAEEAAAAKLAPLAGKVIGKAIPAAISSGLVNKAEGGSALAGAGLGAGGSLVGSALHTIAPTIAETAMGTRRVERVGEKNPGLAVLQDTQGVRPSTVAKSAGAKIAELSTANDALANAHPGLVSTQPAQDVVNQAISTAAQQGQRGSAIPQAQEVLKNLTENPHALGPNSTPGLPRSTLQPASVVQDLKRGIRSDYVSNYDPAMMKGTRAVANQASGALDGSLDAALGPEYAANNDRMSGLFSVKDAMARKALDPSIMQRIGDKALAPTGALAGVIAGAHFGGVPGAVAGAVLPNLLFSPTAQMIAARAAYSPSAAVAARLAALAPLISSRSGDSQ